MAMEDTVMNDQPTKNNDSHTAEQDFWGEPISVYTREQALADGVLVDVTEWASAGPNGMLGGFTLPVALTRALWAVIDIDEHDDRQAANDWRARVRARGESTRGRAHDVLWLARVAASRSPNADRVQYQVLLTLGGSSGRPARKRLTLEASIDGDGVTIGFPEDF
jgi:hypothetical protein